MRRQLKLRTRLLLVLLVLAAAGLIAFGTVTMTLLNQSLTSRLDQQLSSVAAHMSSGRRPPPMPPPQINSRDRLPTDFRVLFFTPGGQLSDKVGQQDNDPSAPALPAMDVSTVAARGHRPFTVDSTGSALRWRVLTAVQEPDRFQPVSGTVAVAVSLGTVDATTSKLQTIELIAGFVLLIVLGLIATWLVRVGLRPVTRIEHTAKAIAGGELDRRVADDNPHTETGRLAGAFNVMLATVSSALRDRERSEQRLRRFVADASHELRTPLTSIRGFAELYRKAGGAVDTPDLMRRIERESIRIGLLVDDLLMLARLDKERPLDLTDVDIGALVTELANDARINHPQRHIDVDCGTEPVRVIADHDRLRQAATNLLTNALLHTPADTQVWITVGRDITSTAGVTAQAGTVPRDGYVVLEVRDNGKGLIEEHAVHVFDRFYRARPTKTDSGAAGTGLGLAIVAAICEAHGGCVQLRTTPDSGATFTILLPTET